MFTQDVFHTLVAPLSDCCPPRASTSAQGLHSMSINFPLPRLKQQNPSTSATAASSSHIARPRGLWKARGARPTTGHSSSDHTGSSPPTPPPTGSATSDYLQANHRKRPFSEDRDERERGEGERWASPDSDEYEYDSDSSAASLSRHHHQHSHHHNHHYYHGQSHSLHGGKRRREDHTEYEYEHDYSPPTSTDGHDLSPADEEVIYWDYSRKCTPNTDRKDKLWTTRTKLMDTSAISGSGPSPLCLSPEAAAAAERLREREKERERASGDLEDWEDLKELFAKAAEMYESQPPVQTLPLLRGVIHECHRFMLMYQDPSVVYTTSSSQQVLTPGQNSINDWLLGERLQKAKSVSVPTSTSTNEKPTATNPAKTSEKKCKCKDLPTAFYTILGTTLFFFGNIVDTSPELCMPGEPSNPVVYWLCALDAFEIGENLPIRTNGRMGASVDYFRGRGSGGRSSTSMSTASGRGGSQTDYKRTTGPSSISGTASAAAAAAGSPPPEDWRMAVVWGRTLVCIAEEVVRRQHEREKKGLPPLNTSAQDAAAEAKERENFAAALLLNPAQPQMPIAPASPFAFGFHSPGSSASPFGPFSPPIHQASSVPDNNADSPAWPPNSPFATIIARRPPLPGRLNLDSGVTPHELLQLAQDQFSRGILHMPHPQHLVHARFVTTEKEENKSMSSFLSTPAHGSAASYAEGSSSTTYTSVDHAARMKGTAASSASSSSRHSHPPSSASSSTTITHAYPQSTASHSHSHPSTESPTFSRAKELYTIAYEVLLLSEKLDSSAERQTWAQWADSVFSQMKMEADTDVGRWRGLITGARGRCLVIVGSAIAEGVEARLDGEKGEMGGDETEEEILKSEDARDAREVLTEAIGFLEKAKEEFEAMRAEQSEGATVVVVQPPIVEEEEEAEEGMIVIQGDEEDEGDEDEHDEEADIDAKLAFSSASTSTLKPTALTSKPPSPTAASATIVNTNTNANNTPEDEIEELKTLLAEALLSLANLTADKHERERLYKRAQTEGGDKFVLDGDDDDEWDEDEKMDEDE